MQAILDYRNAQRAIDLFNAGGKGVEKLEREPHLMDLLLDLHRAQQPGLTLADVLADMQQRTPDESED